MARRCAFGARSCARTLCARLDSWRSRVLRSAESGRTQIDETDEGGIRSRGNLQPRMLRCRNLMAEHESAKPARDVVDYELLFDCVHCGLCLEACPTYI